MIRMSWRETLTRLAVAAVVLIGASWSSAAPLITVQIENPGSGYDPYSVSQEGTAGSGGNYSLSGVGAGVNFNCDWSIVVNEDPQITSKFTLVNTSAVTQTFVMTVTLPIAALGPGTVQGGYFGDPALDTYGDPFGTRYTDTSGNADVTLNTVAGTPFYQALINGFLSQGLGNFIGNNPPGGLNANGGAGIYGSLSQQQWGDPIPSKSFGPVAAGIMQIKWTFTLTSGDQVHTQGFFQVERAPEPGTAMLVGLGLAGLVALRRRA